MFPGCMASVCLTSGHDIRSRSRVRAQALSRGIPSRMAWRTDLGPGIAGRPQPGGVANGPSGDCYDNEMIEPFWDSTARDGRHHVSNWPTRSSNPLRSSTTANGVIPPSGCSRRYGSDCYTNPPNPWPETNHGDTTEPGAHQSPDPPGRVS